MIYRVGFDGKEWIAVVGETRLNRGQLLTKIKSKIANGLDVEEEWTALALIERRITEDRWKLKAIEVLKESLI